jgi:hypothetical protein
MSWTEAEWNGMLVLSCVRWLHDSSAGYVLLVLVFVCCAQGFHKQGDDVMKCMR